MIRYDTISLSEYLAKLALREPVPGGGSAAALSAALGAALVQMVAKYSLGKGKTKAIEKKIMAIDQRAGILRRDLLELVSRDAQAYLGIVAARKKDKASQKKAAMEAGKVSRKIMAISQKALSFLPYLRKEGNCWLQTDVDAAENFLKAAVRTSHIMMKANV
ncbi:MAG: cyclodeaminase/cyclohydrolase family protein [Candidatus Omnitrophica bacterium]|nr:cyclodeaminase/cyclohydrolase family protein [Candidatus Omnitrophota bacterium]